MIPQGGFTRIFSGLLVSLLLIGCSSGGSNGSSQKALDTQTLISMLPANTRGALVIEPGTDTDADLPPAFADLDSMPEGNGVLTVLNYYSGGADLGAVAASLVLGQTDSTEEGYILLAGLSNATVEEAYSDVPLEDAGSYGGIQLQAIAGTSLQLAELNRRSLVIASAATIRSVLDTRDGDKPNIEEGAIAQYIDALSSSLPVNFVYGLPAQYRPITYQGTGDFSLDNAQWLAGSMGQVAAELRGELVFTSDNATTYAERINTTLGLEENPLVSVVDDRTIQVDITGLPVTEGNAIRQLLKTMYHSMNMVDYTEAVVYGGNKPWLNFEVWKDPNPLYIFFEFKDQAQIDAFEANELPSGFSLAPVPVLASDEPAHLVVANIYQSGGGLVSGARVEWSAFVKDPETGDTQFLVIEAVAASISVDSVNLVVFPEPVSYERLPEELVTLVEREEPEGNVPYFSASVRWPQESENRVPLSRELVAADDFIYWGNAVSDRTLYNATKHNREVVLVPETDVTIKDDSRWAPYIKATPSRTIVYRNQLEIVISPWWNLDADYLDVTPEHRQVLIDFKNNFYPDTVQKIADEAVRGNNPPLLPSARNQSLPTSYFHYRLTDPAGLLASLDLKLPVTLTPLQLLAEGEQAHYLTLAVYRDDNDPCGTRAEWWTYASDDEGAYYSLRLLSQSMDACIDPVALLGLPALVDARVENENYHLQLASTSVQVSAELQTQLQISALPSQDWIESGARICALNGICDDYFYDGQTLVAPVKAIDASGATIAQWTTPWNDFIEAFPAAVWLRDNRQPLAVNPWQENLRP